ncbi:hypothetical protein LOTGIDRAFT_233267 [Lottia gigantea]|uniref:Transport and Golgi organization protein 1 homolog n=1 Tax=Lottia gigantea TaxID=225164 RepID=V4A5K1_LOTGI|nr:hypothetical protein LOTGIDRAFT_233267 [Lottia gigantea]ESO91967.1 hypothetical protein LOTGIDRAFT_233267 [Lottia gigantea]
MNVNDYVSGHIFVTKDQIGKNILLSIPDLNKYLKNTFSGGSDETELKEEKIENADTPQELEAKRPEIMKESIQKELEKDKTSQVKEEKELPKDALPKDTFDVRLDDEEEDATEIMDEEALTDSFVKISGEQTEQDPQNSPEVQKSEEKTPPLANQEPPVVSKAPPVEDKPIVEVLRKEDLDGLDSQKNEQMPAQKPDIPAETVPDATATQETEKPPERLTEVPQQTEDCGINATPTQTPPTADKGVPDAAKTSQIVIDGTTIDLNEDYENSLLYTSSQLDIESSTGQLNHVDNLASDQQMHSPAEQIMASADPLHQEDHNGDPIVDILQHKIDSIPAQPDLHLKPESPSAYQSNDYLSRKPLAVNAQSVGQAPVASSQDAPSSGEKAYQTNQQPVYNQDLPKDNAGSLDILDLNPVDNSNQQQNEPHSQVEIENRDPSQSKDWPNGNEQEKETLGDTEVKEEVFAEVTTHPPVVGEPIPPPLEEFTKVPEPVIATEATTKASTQASVTDATTQTQTKTTTETDPVTKSTTQSTYGSDQLPEDNKQESVKNQETYDGEPVIPYDEFPTPDNMEDSFSDIPEERIRESKSLDGVPPTDDDPYKTDPVSSRKMTDEHLEDDQFGVPPKRNGLFDRLFSPILSVLPGFLGRILDQEPLGLSPAMTLLMIITTFIILTITTCCSRSSSGGGKKTADALAVVRKLEEKLFIETKEKENLEDALNQAKKEIIDYEKKLTNQQSKSGSHKADLQNLQLHNESLKQQVVSFQTQIKEYNDEVKDIQGASHGKDKKVKDLEKQVNKLEERAKKAEKALDKKCKEIEDNKEEVETKRSQMKSLSDQVQQLEIRKQQLLSEAADWKEKVEDLNERLYQRDEEFKQMQESVTFKDSELEVLKECFLQLKAFEDESEMKEDPSESSIAVQDKLQTMIDVAKVNATLRAVQDEKDTLTNRLEIETEARKEAEDQLDKARLNMESFQADKMKAERQFQESQTKLNVLSNYFKEKEMQLQRELGEQEVLKKQNINKLNSVDEKSKQTEEERAMYKQQVESLKRELEAADRDFRAQIAANEQKAHENWIAARTAERELKESRHQNTTLRQRLTDFTRKPGPEGLIRPLPTRGLPPGMMNGPPMPLPPGMDRPPVERSPSRGSLPPPHPPSGDYYNDRLPPPDRRLPPGGPRLPPPPLDARSPPPFDRRPPPPHLDRRTPPYRPPHPDMMPPYRGPPPQRDGITSPPPLGPPGYDPRLGPRTSSPYTRPPPPGAPPRDMRDKPPPRQQSQV